jgi:uncharacterized membrane protein
MQKFLGRAMAFLAVSVSAYAALVYSLTEPGALVHPDMRSAFQDNAGVIRLHALAAIAALALGPWQFSAALRARRPRLHRLMGRAYLGIGVLIGGLTGLHLAQFAFGGAPARLGFTLLALAWLYSGWRAYSAIRGGDVRAHREWMMRNFALTFAAVTLRLYVPVAAIAGLPFAQSYAAIAWLCWVPNLAFAHWLTRRQELFRGRGFLWVSPQGASHEIAGDVARGLRRGVRDRVRG